MDFSSGSGPLVAAFCEIFVARNCLCQEFVLTGGIECKSLTYNFHGVRRIDYSRFRFPESVRIDAMASTIQYSATKMTAIADQEERQENATGGRMFSSKTEAAR
jgi:hypothetical protein